MRQNCAQKKDMIITSNLKSAPQTKLGLSEKIVNISPKKMKSMKKLCTRRETCLKL